MNNAVTNFAIGVVTTGVVFAYSYLGLPESINLEKINCPHVEVHPSWQANTYYSLNSDEKYQIAEQISIINNFVSTLLEKAEDLDPRFSETVDKYFWDLV